MADPEHTPPDAARKAFDRHRRNAKSRGIQFLMTFEEWWSWWQTDNRWEKRGRRGGDLVMARTGDLGAYVLDNIYCSTHSDNSRFGAAKNKSPESIAKWINTNRMAHNWAHLRDRERHPRRHQVISPKGVFPSIALAAQENGIKPAYAQKLASKSAKGWGYST